MINRAKLMRCGLLFGVRRVDPNPIFRFLRLKQVQEPRHCRYFSLTARTAANGKPDGDEAESSSYGDTEKKKGDVTKVHRDANPVPYDKNAYVVKLCRNLRQNDPTKYAYFSGLHGGRLGPDGVLRELRPGEKDEELVRLEESIAEVRMKGISMDSSGESSLIVTGGALSIEMKKQEVVVAGKKYYAENTVDYIKRVLETSLELYVINHKEELFEVLDMVANLHPETLTISDEEIERRCIELFPGWIEKTKFGLAYLFFLNRGHPGRNSNWGDNFIEKVIRHLSPDIDILTVEEFTSLMLMVYMRYQPFRGDLLADLLDPTILQEVVLEFISHKTRTDTELCAVFLGLRKFEGMGIYYNDLRDKIYARLETIGRRLSNPAYKVPDKDTMNFINTSIYQMVILLHKGNYFIRDPAKVIMQVQQGFQDAIIAYDPEIGFLLTPSTCLKIATLGITRGGLHDPVVSESFLERLHLGNQVKHLTLKEMCSTLNFTNQIKNVVQDGVDLRPILVKVVKNLANEISMVSDGGDKLLNISDVRFILQSWLYLSSYEVFDEGRIADIFEQVNEMGMEHFKSDPSISMDRQNQILGLKLSEVCFQSLFPYSYSKINDPHAAKQDLGDGYSLEVKPHHATDFVRLLGALNNTIAIYKPDFKPLLDKEKLRRVIELTQSPVPAVIRDSSLPTETLTKRQKLLAAMYQALTSIFVCSEMVEIIHILPHFREPDIVIGMLAGNPMLLPRELLNKQTEEMIPAPDFGNWIVLSVDGPSKNESVQGEGAHAKDITAEPERYRQLIDLGYDVHVITAADKVMIHQGKGKAWAHKLLANIQTGNVQDIPKPYAFQRKNKPDWIFDM